MRNRELIKNIHRYLSLAALLFWLTQVLTGLLITFRWELDDALLGGQQGPFDVAAVSLRLQHIEANPLYTVQSVWASGGISDRYDVHLGDTGRGDRVLRIDGGGTVLRERGDEHGLSRGGLFDFATDLHATLFAGDTGHWIIGLSGLLLATNIVFGLKLAWPRPGLGRRVLFSRPKGPVVASLFGWHRLFGLWIGLPGLLVVFLGGLLALSELLQDYLEWGSPTPAATDPLMQGMPAQPILISPGQAITAALDLYPGAQFSGMYLPDEEEPWYTIRLLSRSEPAQKFGRTAVVINAQSGAVLANQAAAAYPLGRRLVNSLYPLHTGQIAGLPGRILSLLVGLWLLTMMALGLSLFLKRQAARKSARRSSAIT